MENPSVKLEVHLKLPREECRQELFRLFGIRRAPQIEPDVADICQHSPKTVGNKPETSRKIAGK